MERLVVGHQVTVWAEPHLVNWVLSDHQARKLMSTAAPHHQIGVMCMWLGLSRLKNISKLCDDVTQMPIIPPPAILPSFSPVRPWPLGARWVPWSADRGRDNSDLVYRWVCDGCNTTALPLKQQEGKPSRWTELWAGHLVFHFAWKEQWPGVHYTQILRLCPMIF